MIRTTEFQCIVYNSKPLFVLNFVMEKPLIFFKGRYAPLSYSRILNETFYISLPVGVGRGSYD